MNENTNVSVFLSCHLIICHYDSNYSFYSILALFHEIKLCVLAWSTVHVGSVHPKHCHHRRRLRSRRPGLRRLHRRHRAAHLSSWVMLV